VRITVDCLWEAKLDAVERLAVSLGIVVNERARAAWGREWQGWLVRQTSDALHVDAVRARQAAKQAAQSSYTVRDRRASAE
jgi:hypothetical protein